MSPDLQLVGLAFAGSLAAGAATGFGALPALVLRGESRRLLDASLGLAAGIMLAATAFSLLIPAIELGDPLTAALGLLIGVLFLETAGRFIPVPTCPGPTSLMAIWFRLAAPMW